MYQLPRIARRALKRRMAPVLLSGRTKTILAIQTLMTLIGRFHTHPDQFDKRGCGIGEDGGFHLDRRGLSGQTGKTLRGAEGLTEWTVREATGLLLQMNIIVRITPEATFAREDRTGRFGFWLEAKKDGFGRIRAPGIRYKLSSKYRSLFANALGRIQTNHEFNVLPPVYVKPISKDHTKGESGEVGVSTGGRVQKTPEEIAEIRRQVATDWATRNSPDRRAAHLVDLEERRRRREAREAAERLAAKLDAFEALVRAKGNGR